ncbi:hypothetical protein ACJX0J_039642, partial [Zea mays]
MYIATKKEKQTLTGMHLLETKIFYTFEINADLSKSVINKILRCYLIKRDIKMWLEYFCLKVAKILVFLYALLYLHKKIKIGENLGCQYYIVRKGL